MGYRCAEHKGLYWYGALYKVAPHKRGEPCHCGAKHYAKGLCSKHYYQQYRREKKNG